MNLLKAVCLPCILLALCFVVSPATAQDLTLSQNGKTHYVIAVASDSIPAEKTAAEQLQKYLGQVTGAKFVIKPAVQVPADAPQILVGAGPRVKTLLPNQNWDKLGHGGIVIRTVGNKLILAGGRPRGALYAVFQFLENSVGCNWWAPGEKTIPQRSTLKISPKDIVYVSPFDIRNIFSDATRHNPKFSTILRLDGSHQTQSKAWGGHYELLGFVHTMVRMLPPKKYFKDHPEWYTDPKNGDLPCTAESKMPTPANSQLDLTNPQVIDALTKAALARIKKNPSAGYIDISQGDNYHYCKCDRCTALAKAQGSQAAPVIRAVNIIAKRVRQHYPDFKVETLAYTYTVTPPRTLRPGPGVVIRLARIFADFGHPMSSRRWNNQARQAIVSWSKIAPELFFWNYTTNFRNTMLPHPNWAGLGSDLRFFAAHNVKAVFEQGDAYTGGVGDFVQLRTWLMAHLLWNPNLDQEKLTVKFLNGYYGAAGPYLKQYLDLIESAFLAQKRALSTYNTDFSFISLPVANKAIKLFDKAEQAVKNKPALLNRVRRTRLSLQGAILYQWKFLQQQAQQTGQKLLGPSNLETAVKQFKKTAHEFGVRNWGETQSFKGGLAKIVAKQKVSTVPLPAFAKKYPRQDVIDFQPQILHLYRKGKLTHIVKDPAASGGIAATAVGTTTQWAIQARTSKVLNAPGRWHIYVYARVQAKDRAKLNGGAINAGIYDVTNHKSVASFSIPAKKAAGKTYHRFDLGVHKIAPGMYIWFAPRNKKNISKIYIDRIILIRSSVDP